MNALSSSPLSPSLPEGYFFCPSVEPPADEDGNREKRLLQADATIFTFVNCQSSTDALNRWLYCRVLDNTCRELGISPGMTDVEIVEALHARRLPFGEAVARLDLFDGEARYSPLPEAHPSMDVESLVEFYRKTFMRTATAIQAAADAGCDPFAEMGVTASSADWMLRSKDPKARGEGEILLRGIDPVLMQRMENAKAFFDRLVVCLTVAAYLGRFADRVDGALVPAAAHPMEYFCPPGELPEETSAEEYADRLVATYVDECRLDMEDPDEEQIVRLRDIARNTVAKREVALSWDAFSYATYTTVSNDRDISIVLRIADNTCRKLAVSPDDSDDRLVEAVSAAGLPFAPTVDPESDIFAPESATRGELPPEGSSREEVYGYYLTIIGEVSRVQTSVPALLSGQGLELFLERMRTFKGTIYHGARDETDPDLLARFAQSCAWVERLLAAIATVAYERRFPERMMKSV